MKCERCRSDNRVTMITVRRSNVDVILTDLCIDCWDALREFFTFEVPSGPL